MEEWQINATCYNNFRASLHEPLTLSGVILKDPSSDKHLQVATFKFYSSFHRDKQKLQKATHM